MNKPSKIIKHIGYKRYILSFLGLFLFFSIGTYLIFILVQRPEISNYRRRVEASEEAVIRLQSESIDINLSNVVLDLSFISETLLFEHYLDDMVVEVELKAGLANLMDKRISYDQLRYIDTSGIERIRINRDEDIIHIVDDNLLQDKSDRYYFIETMALNQGEVYQSKLDLNIENGELEVPHRPVIRIGTKVYDSEGGEKGILIINFNARAILNGLDSIAESSEGENYLLNSDGFYINGHESQNFSFALKEASDMVKFKDEYVYEWDHIMDEVENGSIYQHYDEGGLFTATLSEGYNNTEDKNNWLLVSVLSNESTLIDHDHKIDFLIFTNYIKVIPLHIILILMTWYIINLYYTKKIQKDQMYHLAKYDQLTATYNRNAGLIMLGENLEYGIQNEFDFSICFIDLNDLKVVNDLYGHEAGDLYLSDSVAILRGAFRKSDIIIRMGGDEFLVGMHCCMEVAEKNWLKVESAIKDFNESNIRRFDVALSHGISSIQEDATKDLEGLIALADERMYVEKRAMKLGTKY